LHYAMLIEHFPEGVKYYDNFALFTPLHVACGEKVIIEVVKILIATYPEA